MDKKMITVSILVLAFIGGFLLFYKHKPVSSPTTDNSTASSTPRQWETRTDEQANVTVTVTPSNLMFDSKEWTFDVVLNTHSVELDQDMSNIVVLVDDSGKEYKPLRWEGAPAGGHHREGTLIFIPITPYPEHLKLNMRDIGGVERSFAWDLFQ